MIRVVACGVLAPLCWGKCGRGSPPATWVLGITTGKIGIFLTQQIMHSRAYLHNIRRGGWGGATPSRIDVPSSGIGGNSSRGGK